jgi:hypothetical protein
MEFDEKVFKKVIVKLTDRERENFKDCTHAVLDLLIFAHDVEGEMNFSALEEDYSQEVQDVLEKLRMTYYTLMDLSNTFSITGHKEEGD